MEAHDADLRIQERAVAREDAWRRRVDQRALALDPPSWLVAELGPVPTETQERAAWRVAAAELDGYRRAYGLDDPGPAKHLGGRVARDGRAAVLAGPLDAEQAGGARRPTKRRHSHHEHGRWGARPRADRSRPAAHHEPPVADGYQRLEPARLLGAEPRRQAPGRRRDWQRVRAALERLGEHRYRDQRHRPHQRTDRLAPRDLGRQERDGL